MVSSSYKKYKYISKSIIRAINLNISYFLQGNYGLKRFCRDGYRTVQEDRHRRFYQKIELQVISVKYLTIIPRVRVGYEMVDGQRGAWRRVCYNHLISNKREWNNCFIKSAHKISGILRLYL